MNASCIDCLAPPASRFSTAAVSARTTSSTSSAVMPDRCRGGRAPARTDPTRRGDAQNSARHLAARDATSRTCRNSEPIGTHSLSSNEGLRLRGPWSDDALGIQPVSNATLGYRQTELKKCLAGSERARVGRDRGVARRSSIERRGPQAKPLWSPAMPSPAPIERLPRPHAISCRSGSARPPSSGP